VISGKGLVLWIPSRFVPAEMFQSSKLPMIWKFGSSKVGQISDQLTKFNFREWMAAPDDLANHGGRGR